MSINESLNRSPKEEIAKRVSEAATGLATAAHAVAVQDHATQQKAYNRRVEDSHRFGMTTAGMKPEDMVSATPEEEKMGDIIVTGDLYGDAAVQALRGPSPVSQQDKPDPEAPAPTAPVPDAPPTKNGMSSWAKAALGLGITALASSLLPAIGLPLAAWLGAFDKPPVHSEFSDTDTFSSVIVRPGGDGGE